MTIRGRSLELYFVDGRPDGLLTAEVFNWTGHVLRVPRPQIKEAFSRPEASYTGVYLLLGEKAETPAIYVGEAEDMRARIKDHIINKDWWDTAVFITSASNSLNKAHVKYLESRLVEIAGSLRVTALDNASMPPRSSLNEAGRANMESFLETLRIVLPAVGIDSFLDKAVKRERMKEAETGESRPPKFILATPKHGVRAEAEIIDGQVVVLAGSRARKDQTVSDDRALGFLKRKRAELLASGVLVEEGENLVFTENYAFKSPSGAGDVLNGRSTNGRVEWKHAVTGKTYAEWETSELTELDP